MSNIYTEFARLYFRPGVTMTAPEIEELLERILDECGSYWVPVTYDLADPTYIDLQYGSGKGAGLHNLEDDHLSLVEDIWVRLADEGSDHDVIYRWSPALGHTYHDGYPRKQVCRYGFDEIEIVLAKDNREAWIPSGIPWQITPEGYRAECFGSYSTLNERIDMDLGPRARLHTPRKPSDGFSAESTPCYDVQMPMLPNARAELGKLLELKQKGIERIELRYWGRLVHIAQWALYHYDENEVEWQHRSGDTWQNCLDEEFVARRKTWV